MAYIKTVDLNKKYGELVAVDNLNLEIEEGELFALLGVNGAGKTTAIKMLSCLTEATSGDAVIGGYSLTGEPSKIKQIIGVSPQETAIAPNLTVRENLEFMCGIHGLRKEEIHDKITDLTDRLGLLEVLGKRAGKLSGGWQRRVSIAMSLVGEPKVLFLDEPTLGLDVIARRELWDVINGLRGKATVILTTHYMEEAEALSDRIGIMKNGKMLAVGRARELMDLTHTERFEDAFISIVKECEK